jgi:UDP-N-acetyl-2-amino-2-deoxyglucuronate dehydrogenase
MAQELRFGLIGVGAVAPRHVTAIQETPGATLVAVCSRNEEKVKKFAQENGRVAWCTDYQEIIRRPDINAVAVTLPHNLHESVCLEAAAAGKHILMEKPLAITVEECDRMIGACEQAGVTLATCFQGRYEPLAKKLHAELNAGKLGRLLLASLHVQWYRDMAYYKSVAWRGKLATEGGGVIINQASHGLDMLLWLAGPVESVTANVATINHDIEVEDVVHAIVRFKSGAMGIIEATTVAYPGFNEELHFSGTDGSAIFEKGAGRIRWHLREPKSEWVDQGEASSGAGSAMAISAGPHIAAYQDFAAAIREKRAPLIDGREGRRSIELIQAIYQSGREQKTVQLG